MAYAFIASTGAGSSDSTSVTTSAIDTTGATLIVISVSTYSALVTPTDSKSNSWTPLTSQTVNTEYSRLYYCVNPTVGTGHTFTVSQAGTYPSLAVMSFSGAHSTPVDQQNGATGGGGQTTLQTGSITPSEDNCLVVCGCMTDPGSAHTMSGYTVTQVNYVGGQHLACGISYNIQTTASATNPTWSWTTAAVPAAVIASFKAAAAAAGTGTNLLLLGAG